jgi:rod shape-determining protein MreC
MEFPISRYRNLTVLLLVILAQLLLLGYQVKSNQDVRLIRVWAVQAVTPMARLLETGRSSTVGMLENYFLLVGVRGKNRQLEAELGKLKLENQFLKTELATADRARALNAFQSRSPSRTIAARIIGTGSSANAKVVFVDRGSTSGVMRGMAVITPDGIVGKVLAAYPTASQVMLITDPSFAAGVLSQKNFVHGTLKGQGHSTCLVDYVQNEEKVEPGELFFTSGDDRVFPKGLPVGAATVVRAGKTFKEIYIVPSGFQGGLEEVLIVVEGVHQQLPSAQASPQAAPMLAPPPAEAQAEDAAARPAAAPSLSTDADRMREHYKRIGEAQGHVFGGTGTRPPDFNIKPAAQPPGPPSTSQPKPADKPPGNPPSTTPPAEKPPSQP